MNLDLLGKRALVSGASRGIGLAIAHALHAEGCRLALAARGRSALEAAGKALPSATLHVGDAAKDARSIVEQATADGGLDILICNAGNGRSVPPGQETEIEWRRMLDENLYTTLNMVSAARPRMNEGGAIVCISSIAGLAALGAPIAYSAAKAALNAAVRGLARPLAAQGLRINAVAPGNILFDGSVWQQKLNEDQCGVQTMLERDVALGRLGGAEEIASVAVFLSSSKASFITGTILVADGGQLR